MDKVVVYFSESGNTRYIADIIQKQENCDILEIKTKTPYVKDYNKLIEVAKKEIQEDFKPSIEDIDVSDYDFIYLGTPNWWSTIAPPVATFLSKNDLNGKTIAPFITHGGGGKGSIMEDIRNSAQDSEILNPFSIAGRGGLDIDDVIKEWLIV